MTILSDIRTRVRKDLHDTDAGNYRWTDSQLDRHIERALSDLSLAAPQEKTATIATMGGSRDISLSSLAGLLEVEAVEYPVGEFPPSLVEYSRWASTLTLNVETLPSGGNAKLFYTARHTLDGSGSTVQPELEDALAIGAAAFAALELSSYTTDRVTTGADVARQYAAWGNAWQMAFRELLRMHARRNRVRPRRMYVPA
ncbi:hypothetical protein AYO38_06810 [bacterium SCGC AG-212-C10]|nr:hypothetical protein AYO38_06810 [bacterium SCGC AG-212-C10]